MHVSYPLPGRIARAARSEPIPDRVGAAVGPTALLYRLYERRLAGDLRRRGGLPRHVGVIMDGNRRWARQLGINTMAGHRRGADQIDHLLGTHPAEVAGLLEIIKNKVRQLSLQGGSDAYRIVPVGQLATLPERTRTVLEEAEKASRARTGGVLHVAVGYGGREEIADAVHRLLADYAQKGLDLAEASRLVTPDEIARHLYTAGVPDPDLIIRTSGEIRLSGFLLWQSAHAEYYFADAYWPDFRKVDFLRALRSYAQRQRRFGR